MGTAEQAPGNTEPQHLAAAPERDPRQRLLAALAASIRERGLRATQIADVVRLAHTSRRTFYECFADKEASVVELIREFTTDLLAQIEGSVDAAAPWPEQVEQAIQTYLRALAMDPALTATVSHELPALGMRGAAVQREGIERYAELVVRLVRSEAMHRAGVRELSLPTAVMLVGGLNELVLRAVERGEPLDAVAAVASEVFIAALDPRPRSRPPSR